MSPSHSSPRYINTVTAARAALFLVAASAAILMLGPFQGAERLFLLSDKEAHATAFFCLTLLTFLAAPNLRRNDIALVVVALGAAAEVAQTCVGRDGNLADLMADAVGVLAAWAPARAETLRQQSRKPLRLDRRHRGRAALAHGALARSLRAESRGAN